MLQQNFHVVSYSGGGGGGGTHKAVRRNFFWGGQDWSTIFEGKRKRGGRVWESFCIFEIEIEQSGAHFGWIFWNFLFFF